MRKLAFLFSATAAGIMLEEMEAFAAADPAVQGGLLVVEIRPWHVAMNAT